MFNKAFIYQYISKIDKIDIINFSNKQNIILDNNEIDIIYYYIKNRYEDIINEPDKILLEVKDKLNKKTYDKLLELYDNIKKIS